MYYRILCPACRYKDTLYEFERKSETRFSSGFITATLTVENISGGVDKLVCQWKNDTESALVCQPEIRIATAFVPTHYVIPGVLYNGNEWGLGKEPKGLTRDGKPWVFDDRRTAIPSCTVSENDSIYFALMASDADDDSLLSSCSMERFDDGTMLHRILYPEIERPLTYVNRDKYGPPHEEYVTILPGGTFTTTAFLLYGKPVLTNYAAASVEDAALDLLGSPLSPRYTPEEVIPLCVSFAKLLLRDVGERKMLCIGLSPDDENRFRQVWGSEFGWCGQNGLYARLMLKRGTELGDRDLISTGAEILDAFSSEAVAPTGLIHTHYDRIVSGGSNIEDTCNLGFAVCEFSKAWSYMYGQGEDHAGWLKAARGIADFMLSRWSDSFGFGKAWDVETGECADTEGTIGAYLIPGLTALYQATNEEKYLFAAQRACRFYAERDLTKFKCTAGALDTYCIDKETSGSLLAGAMELYGIDGSPEWLEYAKMAGWYFCSWMFHHDTVNIRDSDFETYGYRTLGGTTVSAQHHHIDLWGAMTVPYMFRLWEITGDGHWKKRADLMWANAVQNIAPPEGKIINGRYRAAGAQNEAYFHCHWGGSGMPGKINDWLVAWPQAFCWNTADWMTEHGGF